jgi:hypothetical protein
MSYKVDCPYCSHENEIDDLEDDNPDIECDNCKKEFEVTVEYEPLLTGYEIEYKNCIDCGKEYRHTGHSFPIPNKYKDIKMEDYNVCCECYMKESVNDLKKGTIK